MSANETTAASSGSSTTGVEELRVLLGELIAHSRLAGAQYALKKDNAGATAREKRTEASILARLTETEAQLRVARERETQLLNEQDEQARRATLQHRRIEALESDLAALRRQQEGDTRARGSENRPELPGPVEVQLSDWSQAETCLGGRSDDALVTLSVGKRHVGTIPLGWFRDHTTFDLYEAAVLENRREDAARPSPPTPTPVEGAD